MKNLFIYLIIMAVAIVLQPSISFGMACKHVFKNSGPQLYADFKVVRLGTKKEKFLAVVRVSEVHKSSSNSEKIDLKEGDTIYIVSDRREKSGLKRGAKLKGVQILESNIVPNPKQKETKGYSLYSVPKVQNTSNKGSSETVKPSLEKSTSSDKKKKVTETSETRKEPLPEDSWDLSKSEWFKLKSDKKIEVISDYQPNTSMESIKLQGKTKEEKEFIKWIKDEVLKKIDREAIEQELVEGRFIYGEPEITIRLVHLKDGTLVGSAVSVMQNGGVLKKRDADREAEFEGYFKTEKEAIEAGGNVKEDISWSADAVVLINKAGKIKAHPRSASDYGEFSYYWTGY